MNKLHVIPPMARRQVGMVHLPLLLGCRRQYNGASRAADNHEDSVREVRRRLLPIFAKIREAGGFVNLEAPRDREAEGLPPVFQRAGLRFHDQGNPYRLPQWAYGGGNRMRESYPMVIGGKEFWQGEPIVSVGPARPREVVGTAYGITRELADHAVRAAREAQNG